ncbi:hypothetical protein V5O48_001054 [Marasmius crinis-equi]|uniref:Cytochrome P450 n=1 Tax=Marasmius crinis-equi TaxID=585013 RepID=A0ABR3FZF7_9AGAR
MALSLLAGNLFHTALCAALAAIAILSWYIFYRLVIYPLYLSPLCDLPGPPYAFASSPILGSYGDFINKGALTLNGRWLTQYGQKVRLIGPLGVERIVFTSPEALHTILNTEWLNFPKPQFVIELMGFVAGYGLLTTTGKEHRRMRKVLNPAFSISQLSSQTYMYHEPIETLVDMLCEQIDQEQQSVGNRFSTEPVYEWMRKVTLDIICSTAFGYNSNCLRNPQDELAEAYEELVVLQSLDNLFLFGIVLSIPGIPRLIKTEWAFRYRKLIGLIPGFKPTSIMIGAMHRVREISAKILKQRVAEAEAITAEDTSGKNDIMSILVRARIETLRRQQLSGDSDDSYAMSEAEMMDQVLNFLGAGHETTAAGLTWTLWLLANSKEWQQRVREELMPLYEPDENGIRRGRLGYRQYQELPCLDRVVNESLRLYPPVPFVSRRCTETTVVDGVVVQEGTYVSMPIQLLNTLEDVWGEDATQFNPSRWEKLPDNYDSTYSFLSFLTGPHSCIGKAMAVVELKAVLSALLVNFEFEPSYSGQTVQAAALISLRPEDGMPLRIRRL